MSYYDPRINNPNPHVYQTHHVHPTITQPQQPQQANNNMNSGSQYVFSNNSPAAPASNSTQFISLSSEEYRILAKQMGMADEIVSRRLVYGRFLDFTQQQLKEIYKFCKSNPKFAHTGAIRVPASGKKKEFLDAVTKMFTITNDNNIANTTSNTNNSSSNNLYNNSYSSNSQYHNRSGNNTHNINGSYSHNSINNSHHSNNMNNNSSNVSYRSAEDLVSDLNFHRLRCPYDSVITILAKQLFQPLNSNPHNLVAQLNFALNHEIFNTLKSRVAAGPGRLDVHIRLFHSVTLSHTPFDRSFRVRVNNHDVPIPDAKKLSKSKKKGLDLVRPLIINEFCSTTMNSVTVDYVRSNHVNDPFKGVCVIELVKEKDTRELVAAVKTRSLNPHSALLDKKKCGVCGSTQGLLRCSRCKKEWYCGEAHQKQHWPTHRTGCFPPTPEQEQEIQARDALAHSAESQSAPSTKTRFPVESTVKSEKRQGGPLEEDDDLVEVDSMVSLKCPLSIDRIEIAAKGKNCHHRTCFDLATFLQICQQSGVWQCPLCYLPLPYEEIEIDTVMNNVLKEVDSEIEKIKVLPTGEYTIVQLNTSTDLNKRKKLKLENPSNPQPSSSPLTHSIPHPPNNINNHYSSDGSGAFHVNGIQSIPAGSIGVTGSGSGVPSAVSAPVVLDFLSDDLNINSSASTNPSIPISIPIPPIGSNSNQTINPLANTPITSTNSFTANNINTGAGASVDDAIVID